MTKQIKTIKTQSKSSKKRVNKRSSSEPQGVKIAQSIVRVTKGLFIGAVGVSIVGAVVWIYAALTIHPYLDIKSIEVRGEARLADEDIVILSGIKSGTNIISLVIKDAIRNIKSNDFIKKVEVRRILPDKVIIDVEEFTPKAFIMTSGLYVMDDSGEIFKKFSPSDNLDLPIVTGLEKALKNESALKTMALKFIDITGVTEGLGLEEISEVHVDSLYGVTVHTTVDGTKLKMGVSDFEKKIGNLKTFLDARENGLRGIESVDLDNDRGIVVNFKEGSGSEA